MLLLELLYSIDILTDNSSAAAAPSLLSLVTCCCNKLTATSASRFRTALRSFEAANWSTAGEVSV